MEGADDDTDEAANFAAGVANMGPALGAGDLERMFPSFTDSMQDDYIETDDMPWRVVL